MGHKKRLDQALATLVDTAASGNARWLGSQKATLIVAEIDRLRREVKTLRAAAVQDAGYVRGLKAERDASVAAVEAEREKVDQLLDESAKRINTLKDERDTAQAALDARDRADEILDLIRTGHIHSGDKILLGIDPGSDAPPVTYVHRGFGRIPKIYPFPDPPASEVVWVAGPVGHFDANRVREALHVAAGILTSRSKGDGHKIDDDAVILTKIAESWR